MRKPIAGSPVERLQLRAVPKPVKQAAVEHFDSRLSPKSCAVTAFDLSRLRCWGYVPIAVIVKQRIGVIDQVQASELTRRFVQVLSSGGVIRVVSACDELAFLLVPIPGDHQGGQAMMWVPAEGVEL